jgi:hypothetical protein
MDQHELIHVPSEHLEARITELSARIAASMCEWLQLVGEFARRDGHLTWECHSVAHWLNWQCGIALGAAREHVRVGLALETLPVITEAFASGRISYSKVRAITRVATPTNEDVLVGYALAGTASHVERIVRAYRKREPLALKDEESQHNTRGLYYQWTDDGSLEINGRLPAEIGALLLTALKEATRVPAETSDTPSQRLADALGRICDGYLADPGTTRVDRTMIVAHAGDDCCHLQDSPSISQAALERLACDAVLVDADTGASTHVVPPKMRRALEARDGHRCQFPSCTHTAWLDAHHRHYWTNGGPTTLDNLILLCRHHHQAIHQRGWTIDPDRTFKDPNGRPATTEPHTAQPLEPQPHINAHTPIPNWYGERLYDRDIIPVD